MPAPRRRERQRIRIDGFFDIETGEWDQYVVGGLLTDRGFTAASWQREDDLVDAILDVEGDVWAANGGRYDALWFLKHMVRRRRKCRPIGNGQRIVRLVVDDGPTICDMTALVPLPLRKAALLGKYPKLETGLPCSCPQYTVRGNPGCGGYCSIRRGMPPAQLARLVEYLRYDCASGLSALRCLQDFADEHDLDLAPTIGRASWLTAARRLGIPAADWGREGASQRYRFVRDGYYGGRTQCFRPRADRVLCYDLTGAYPHALSTVSFPTGERRELDGEAARRAYDRGREGVYQAVVRVEEDTFVPPLPLRTRERLAYPVGRLAGRWTRLELEYAEEVGAVVEDVSRAVVWTGTDAVYADYFRFLQSVRQAVGFRTPLGQYCKWFGNAPSGKLAQRPDGDAVVVCPERRPEPCPADADCRGRCSPQVGCCPHLCWRRCARALDPKHQIWATPTWHIPDCGYVEHAAYVTAATRVEDHRQLTDDGQGGRTAVYCDTDSCKATTPRTRNVGGDSGQWKYEGAWREWDCAGPKTYRGVDEETGEVHGASKGVPDAARNYERLARGESVVVARGVQTFRTAAARGDLFRRRERADGTPFTRRIHADGVHWGDRTLGPDGLTYPPDASTLRG